MPVSLALRPPRPLVEQLRRSQIYRDYEKAFRETTGLPLALRGRGSFNLPHHGDPNENPFCALMAGTNHTCASCLQLQQRVEEATTVEPQTLQCAAGLSDSAVPVRVGEELVAFLQTGQVLLRKPTAAQLRKLTGLLARFGVEADLPQFAAAYGRSRVVPPKQYQSILQLLTIFAQHLGALSNQLAVQEEAREAPAIGRARAYITEHHAAEMSLTQVATAVNMSAFYFCKSFRKATGLTFTDYVARVRVEKVKELLLNPNKRVSEAAYEAGFQSLSQFNRVFRRVAGEPPSAYRGKLG
ncbi:helix-turn-helix domain-containing protein [Opitutus sp. GAS368]|uniref:helix-turn-helix domain-containing protein n=1 Tax=Opitutus sp. GAS368 TaxID=1882749 RepID=UPI00087BE49D|nr:helix-turn-helix domain-containing protein [Opitutus sp. GAS368]SDS44605.1 PocR sensory domain-containing protein [Opitutus sp. GAS368]